MKDGASVTQGKTVPIGAWCNVRFVGSNEFARWYISFGEWDESSPKTDSFGFNDEKIAFYSSWEELPSFLNKNSGEDFYIVAIEGINVREVQQ
jgi:hypothetical protein